jgi:CubicO group peptidase (beta-lactamase class C family)
MSTVSAKISGAVRRFPTSLEILTMTPSISSQPTTFKDGLSRGAPSEASVDIGALNAFLDEAETLGLELHGLMLWRDGKVISEGYWWPYRADQPQIMHSVAKSFTSTAIGLALEEGRFALSDKVISFFPNDLPDVVSANLAAMTIEDLLTMRTGHASEVGGPMWRILKTSWIREFFNIPVVHKPGATYVYSSAASYMLAAILYQTTGQGLHHYLKPRLFEPLGIHGETWDLGTDGFNPGGNGLTCSLADVMKLGILYANKGVWNGDRLISAQWVEEATRPHNGNEYGYHWVVYKEGAFAALGQFAQIVLVFPKFNAVLGLTSAIRDADTLAPVIFRHFPAAFHGPAADEARQSQNFKARFAQNSAAPKLTGRPDDSVWTPGAHIFHLAPNPYGIETVMFDLSEHICKMEWRDAHDVYRLEAGIDQWREGVANLPGQDLHHGYELKDAKVIAGAQFPDLQTMELVWSYPKTAFRDRLVCRINAHGLTLDRSVNVNSRAMGWTRLNGRRT